MADSPTGNPYNPIITAQQYPTTMLSSGSAGTNDTAGTAEPIRWGGDPATGAGYVSVIGGISVSGGSNVNVFTGTLNRVHDLGTVGSVISIGQVHNAGTIQGLPQVSVGTIPGLSSGTINVGTFVYPSGTVTTIVAGTQNTLGTVENLNNGTVRISVGTITTGSLTNLASLHSGTINVGTFVAPSGTVTTIVAGTQNTLGTVGVVNNLVTGTIASARIDYRPVGSSVISTHTLGTGGGTVVGTILAPVGAGTNLYLAGLSLVVHSGTVDCGIANNVAGTTGAGVYARGLFVPSAGIMRDFNPAINVGENGTLAFFLISAGTVSFTANYWVTP